MDKWFPLLALKHAPNFIKKEALAQVFSCEFRKMSKNTLFYRTPLVVAPETRPWGLNGTRYWRLFIVEYLQLDKFKERLNFDPKYHVSCFFFRWAMHHVSMYFLGKAVFRFLPRVKRSCFQEKNTIFPDNTRKITCRRGTLWKDHNFRRSEENIIFPCIF